MSSTDDTMLLYREAARGLWNHALRVGADFDRVDAFRATRALLFDELVLRPLGRKGFRRRSDREPYPWLRVVPMVDPVPIEINRPSPDHNMYWDYPVDSLRSAGLALQFIDHFDWNDFGYIDLRYYRVKIMSCAEVPEVVGREALLEVGHAVVECAVGAASPSEMDSADP